MRILYAAALAVFTLGATFSANDANAARGKWECVGPAYVCGSPTKARKYTGLNTKKVYKKKASKKAKSWKKAAYKKSPRKTYKKRAYGGSVLTGKASYYWQPQPVASGGRFNPNAMTAAHKTLPFGTRVRVTNLRNGRSVVVRINDRGPYIKGRIIDLSRAAAGKIQMRKAGVVPVKVTILGRS